MDFFFSFSSLTQVSLLCSPTFRYVRLARGGSLQASAAQEKQSGHHCASLTGHFKLSTAHIKKHTRKQVISILICYLAQHVHNIVILTYNQYKDLSMRYFMFFFIVSLQKPFCILHLKLISIWTSLIFNAL